MHDTWGIEIDDGQGGWFLSSEGLYPTRREAIIRLAEFLKVTGISDEDVRISRFNAIRVGTDDLD